MNKSCVECNFQLKVSVGPFTLNEMEDISKKQIILNFELVAVRLAIRVRDALPTAKHFEVTTFFRYIIQKKKFRLLIFSSCYLSATLAVV